MPRPDHPAVRLLLEKAAADAARSPPPTAEEILAAEAGAGAEAAARLRPPAELLDAADLLYRYHWAVRDARIDGRPAPVGLDPSVVVEWHYALNWLIGYGDAAWDEITTDT